MPMIVRKLRLERGWTQEHLAQLTGLSVRSIQRIERGQSCSLETRNSLAAVFNVERSMFDSKDATGNELAAPTAVDPAAVAQVTSLKGFLSHVYLFGIVAVLVGVALDPSQPAVLGCLVGWGIGLLVHGLTAFGFLNVFSPEWERQQIESFTRLRGDSMKIFAGLSASATLLAGIALLGWVSYDATDVMQFLGLQDGMEEAAVALITLLLGSLLVISGIYIWRRILRPSAATSV